LNPSGQHQLYIQEGLNGEPYDMRLYRIREKETSPSPSNQPSSLPSVSNKPSYFPTPSPSNGPTTNPSQRVGPGIAGGFHTPADDPGTTGDDEEEYSNIEVYDNVGFPTAAPNPVHSQNEYDAAPDFADWDDFFESPSLHDGLAEILNDYKVVIAYTGSRFYGTITDSNATLDELFPPDYHAFWSESFDVDRTFIISDATSTSSPVGVDFFEMRRRFNTLLNPNVQFSYGPYGALIPLMEYQGTGFFHCLDETQHPSSSPSSSTVPAFSALPT